MEVDGQLLRATLEGELSGDGTSVVRRKGRGKHTNSLSESLGCTAISPGYLGQDFPALCNSVSDISVFIQSSNIY